MSHLPLKNVSVIATRGHAKFKTFTSGNGAFSLSVPPGTYMVAAACGKAEPPTVRVQPGAKVKRNIECQFV